MGVGVVGREWSGKVGKRRGGHGSGSGREWRGKVGKRMGGHGSGSGREGSGAGEWCNTWQQS